MCLDAPFKRRSMATNAKWRCSPYTMTPAHIENELTRLVSDLGGYCNRVKALSTASEDWYGEPLLKLRASSVSSWLANESSCLFGPLHSKLFEAAVATVPFPSSELASHARAEPFSAMSKKSVQEQRESAFSVSKAEHPNTDL
jgi:hypothetical protein